MNWIEIEQEKPTKSDVYFVKSKTGRKAVVYYDVESDVWHFNSLASNNNKYVLWLKE
jgi:hypothetical protein